MTQTNRHAFFRGIHDGIPIALGYFAVSFSLGINARSAGLSAFQAFLASLLNNASAGEFAGFTLIAAGAGYLELALMTLITNARYLLMSCALSQKFSEGTPFFHRLFIGFDVTDEIFAISMMQKGKLNPFYSYGAFLVAIPGWSIGTLLGVIVGDILPASIVSALSVSLYGMFIAIIIPPGRKNPVIAVLVAISMIISYLVSKLPLFHALSTGTRIILLTLLLAGAAAVFFPVTEDTKKEDTLHET